MFSTHTSIHTHTHTHTHKSKGAKILFGNIRYQISEISDSKCFREGTCLAAQWLELHASSTEGQGPIPGPGTKISGIAKKLKQNKKYTIREENRAAPGTHVQRKGPLCRSLCVAGGFLHSWGDCLWTTQAHQRSLWMCPQPTGTTANQDTHAREGNTKDAYRWLCVPGSQLTNWPKATLDHFTDWTLTWPEGWKLKTEVNAVLCT